MERIALVTDSTCDLPQEILEQYNIHVVPLNVIFGEKNYRDGVDLNAERFFEMLGTERHHPRTSQPAPGDFVVVYEQLKDYDHIISIHLSSKLSGTYQSALLARDLMSDLNISLIDSQSASIGLGWVVLLAARAIAAGKSKDEVVAIAERAAAQQHILLTVESLEWLHKNGRIGKASALLGGLLNVRPVLHIEEGVVAAYGKQRGKMEKVLQHMVDSMTTIIDPQQPVYIGIVHATSEEMAEYVAELLQKTYTVKELIIGSVGPVIGVNTGPGTVGFVALPCHD
ncbi:MAG TPA: DegV family protein [Firmicutes bacterium]|nr:DegV family protein [Bacillota bacterium]